MQEDIEIISDIKKAVIALKEHKLLLSNKVFYYEKLGRVLVIGNNSKYTLSYDEFIELYDKQEFVVYEDKDDSIDIERDNEYYSWTHK